MTNSADALHANDDDGKSTPGLLSRIATTIETNGLYRILAALGALTILGVGFAAGEYLLNKDERAKARRYEAWTFLIAARGALGVPEYDAKGNCADANWGLAEPILQLAEEKVNLEALNLPNAYLKWMVAPGLQLPQAQLFCSTLDNSNFRKANFKHAQIEDANISCVDLSGADLREAKLAKSGFRRSILIKADLRGADLSHANFRAAVLEGALLDGANFTDARFPRTDLRNADLSGAKGLTPDQISSSCTKQGSTVLPEEWSQVARDTFTWNEAACLPQMKWSELVKDTRLCD